MQQSTVVPSEAVVLNHSLPGIVVHTALRREVRLAGPLVRGVAPGDVRRAGEVAEHLGLVLALLAHHHELEDDMIWPAIVSRAPEQGSLVRLMQEQHAVLEELLARTGELLPRWAGGATVEHAGALGGVLDDLHSALDEHLDIEERAVFPLAEHLLTPEEWAEMGRRGEEAANGPQRLLVFGILAYEADPAVLASMLSSAPLPVRMLLPRLARRAYRRHAARIHGNRTP